MKYLLSTFLFLSAVSAFSQETVINDKNAVTRDVQAFTAIHVSGGIDLFLSQGNTEALAVSASEDKFRNKIKTEVVNGTLRIYYENDKMSFSTANKKLKAYVSFKNLNALEATGASDVKISGVIQANILKIHLSGASDLEGSVKVNDLTISTSGASDVKLTGTVVSINIEASGASDVKAYGLITDECTARATGASDIQLTVNKQLSAHASGASSVNYKGEGVIKEVHTSGASSVSKKS